jgi:hypothetical protein
MQPVNIFISEELICQICNVYPSVENRLISRSVRSATPIKLRCDTFPHKESCVTDLELVDCPTFGLMHDLKCFSRTLTSLVLHDCSTPITIEAFVSLVNLESFVLNAYAPREYAAQHLTALMASLPSMKSLTSLTVFADLQLSDLSLIGKHVILENLCIFVVIHDIADLNPLSTLTALKSLEVELSDASVHNNSRKSLSWISNLQQLKKLHIFVMNWNSDDDDGDNDNVHENELHIVKASLNPIVSLPNLQHLDLSGLERIVEIHESVFIARPHVTFKMEPNFSRHCPRLDMDEFYEDWRQKEVSEAMDDDWMTSLNGASANGLM